MFLNVRIHSLIRFFFYLILIGVSIQSWNNLIDEHTTFEEAIVENDARLPSVTLCPNSNSVENKSIESFEDVAQEIEKAKIKYRILHMDYKQFEEFKISHETYNDTSNNTWYFVPKISDYAPFKTVICLIWTPSKEYKIEPGWGLEVSFSNFSKFF